MNDYYDYCEDCDRKSKADEIIDDAKNKLVDLIWEQVKGELEVTQKENELLAKKNAQLQKENFELIEKEKVLQIDNEHLKAEMERQDNLVPRTPFVVGEKVYFIQQWDEGKISCATCGGEGQVTVQDKRFGEITIKCPKCHGESVVKYPIFRVREAWIESIQTTIKLRSKHICFEYWLAESPKNSTRLLIKTTEIFKETDDLHKIVTERNQKAKEAVEIKMGIKKVEE